MLENMRISIQGIWSHKMRSFLTMLGIIIGIASIIAIVSTIKGTSEQIKEDPVSYTHLDVYKRQVLREFPKSWKKKALQEKALTRILACSVRSPLISRVCATLKKS